jgi:hypothetical protein
VVILFQLVVQISNDWKINANRRLFNFIGWLIIFLRASFLQNDSKKRLQFGGTQCRENDVFNTMFPIIIFTEKRIFKYYTGFSFFIFIWISRLEKNAERLIRHESIHFYQQLELLFVFHWLLYGLFYAISRLKGQRHYICYRYNPFEIEAYDNDHSEHYLRSRRAYSWVKYLKPFWETQSRDMKSHLPKDKYINY